MQSLTIPAGVEFVPMIWAGKYLTSSNLATAKSSGTTLLTFNEPDIADQADMTVAVRPSSTHPDHGPWELPRQMTWHVHASDWCCGVEFLLHAGIFALTRKYTCAAQQAVALWPTLAAAGMTLGSPATSSPATQPGGWFSQFWGNVSCPFAGFVSLQHAHHRM